LGGGKVLASHSFMAWSLRSPPFLHRGPWSEIEGRPYGVWQFALALEVRPGEHFANQAHRYELHANHHQHHAEEQERVALTLREAVANSVNQQKHVPKLAGLQAG
jgi:hypothetical protein